MAKNSRGPSKRADDFDDTDQSRVEHVEGEEGTEVEHAPAATATATPVRRDSGLDELRERVRALQDKRQAHLAGVDEINQSLAEIRSEIDLVLNSHTDNGNAHRTVTKRKVGRPAHATTRGRGRPTRGGKSSGTAIIESLLEKAGGSMASSELAEEAIKKGVKYPHSSYQSLKKRGRIELDDGTVRLLDAK